MLSGENKIEVNNIDASQFAAIRRQLNSQPPPGLAMLHQFWQQYRGLANCPADVLLKLGDLILKRGEPILAYDALSHGLSRVRLGENPDPENMRIGLRLKQLLCLALAQSGAAGRALAGLEQLCLDGHDTPETRGLLGRVHKDLALRAVNLTDRQTHLSEASKNYQIGFERGDATYHEHGRSADAEDAYYCGINSAAVAVLRGEMETARQTADRVREICETLMKSAESSYWLLATLGEAELICGRLNLARQWYGKAVEKAGDSWRELASTRRQARMLSQQLGLSVTDWDTVFPKIGIVAFTSPAWTGDKLPVDGDWYAQSRQSIGHHIRQTGIIAGYLSALSPVDVVFGECLLENSSEVHIVLPYPRTLCRAVFVTEPIWQQRLDKLLSSASSIVDDNERSCLDERVNAQFAGLRLFGAAALRTNRLDGDLYLWSCEQGPWPTWAKPEDAPSQYRHHPKFAWQSILPMPTEFQTESKMVDDRVENKSQVLKSAANESHEVKAMLFADVKGYSKLDDVSLFRFGRTFMQHVARVLDRHEAKIELRRTAGDGLFLVFTDVAAAAEVAFDLRDMMIRTAWTEFNLPPQLGLRISLDAGPVYFFHDAVMRRQEVCGTYVNRAARIEPITPPNEVYASEAFASLYVATGADQFRFDYVGQTQLPKGFGLTPLYCLLRQISQPSP